MHVLVSLMCTYARVRIISCASLTWGCLSLHAVWAQHSHLTARNCELKAMCRPVPSMTDQPALQSSASSQAWHTVEDKVSEPWLQRWTSQKWACYFLEVPVSGPQRSLRIHVASVEEGSPKELIPEGAWGKGRSEPGGQKWGHCTERKEQHM
jgi:hypothetical protein